MSYKRQRIRSDGLLLAVAGVRIAWLLRESLRGMLSSVALKDGSKTALIDAERR